MSGAIVGHSRLIHSNLVVFFQLGLKVDTSLVYVCEREKEASFRNVLTLTQTMLVPRFEIDYLANMYVGI